MIYYTINKIKPKPIKQKLKKPKLPTKTNSNPLKTNMSVPLGVHRSMPTKAEYPLCAQTVLLYPHLYLEEFPLPQHVQQLQPESKV